MAYRTRGDADTYFAAQIAAHVTDWTGASDADKDAALQMASDAIDKLSYKGVKNTVYTALVAAGGDTDQVADVMLAQTTLTEKEIQTADDAQATAFPRDGAADIPDQMFYAVCEEARELLSGRNPEQEQRNLALTSEGTGTYRASFDRSKRVEHTIHGIVSPKAWGLLRPFLSPDNRSFDLRRV